MWNTYNPENKYRLRRLRIEIANGSFHHMIPKLQHPQNPLFQGIGEILSLCFPGREISFLPRYIQITLVVTTGTYCMRFSQGPISTHSWTKSWKQVHHVGKKSDLYDHYQKSPSVKAAHNFHGNWVSLPQNDPQCSPKPSLSCVMFVATSLTNKQQKILPSFCRQNFLHWGPPWGACFTISIHCPPATQDLVGDCRRMRGVVPRKLAVHFINVLIET